MKEYQAKSEKEQIERLTRMIEEDLEDEYEMFRLNNNIT
jgi:hypothetical protein